MAIIRPMPIFPTGSIDFVRRRLHQALGIVWLGLSAAITVAVLTFDASDPSLNHATAAGPRNALGVTGAYVADALLHSVGWGILLPITAMVLWGRCWLRMRPLSGFGWRFAATAVSTLVMAAIFAVLPVPSGWPLACGLGGVIGDITVYQGFAPLIGSGFFSAALVVILGLPLALLLWGFGAGITLTEAVEGGQRMTIAARRLIATLKTRADQRTEPCAPAPAKPRREPVFAAKAKSAAAATAEIETPQPVVEQRDRRVRSGKAAQQRAQSTFDFAEAEAKTLPPLDLLQPPAPADASAQLSTEALEQNARMLATVLADFGVKGDIVKVRPGPVVTMYELEPAPGTKSSRIISLADDIARSMSAVSARIAVVPGRNAIGIELPNQKRETVSLRELLASQAYERGGGALTLVLGKDIGGAPVMVDLARMPHLLIAGTTGSGKSVSINTMILSLLYRLSPEEARLILIDPKMLELSVYDGIPHLLTPVVTEPSKAVVALKWAVREMEDRYRVMSQLGVRNVAGYNARLAQAERAGEVLTRTVQTGFDEAGDPVFEDQPLDLAPFPLIVVVVDEMADLMLVAGKDIEAAVQRLSQMARAAGIHLIMATQRPSVDVVTGTIKANFPTRISFQVSSKIDSRTVLGEIGAEQLLGQGDMLFMAGGGRVTRVHGPFVSDREVEKVVQFLKSMGAPQYLEAVTEEDDADSAIFGFGGGGGGDGDDSDGLYDQAVATVAREGKASTSFVQRRLQIGYNRAARLIERMEAEGIVSKPDRVGRREVLVGDHSS